MRLNENLALVSNKVVLVPYEASHVKTYSEWMSDEALREATASERLSLPEEYAMQASWRTDPDKLTFIAALPSNSSPSSSKENDIIEGVDDVPELLVGDINLFITLDDGDEGDQGSNMFVGEVELMIARDGQRGKGIGKAVLLLFMKYVLEQGERLLEKDEGKLVKLKVKIGEENEKSLRLFEGVGFAKVGEKVSYFGEWELSMNVVEGETREDKLKMVGKKLEAARVTDFRTVKYMRQVYLHTETTS